MAVAHLAVKPRDVCSNSRCAQACWFANLCCYILIVAVSHLQEVQLPLLCPLSQDPSMGLDDGGAPFMKVWGSHMSGAGEWGGWGTVLGRGKPSPAVEEAMGRVLLFVTFDRSATYAASHCRPGLPSESASSLSRHEVKSSLRSWKAEKQQMEPINLPSENRPICGDLSPSEGRVGTGSGYCMHAGKICGQPIINPQCISSHKMLDVPSERLLKSLICSWHSFSIAGSKKAWPGCSDISSLGSVAIPQPHSQSIGTRTPPPLPSQGSSFPSKRIHSGAGDGRSR